MKTLHFEVKKLILAAVAMLAMAAFLWGPRVLGAIPASNGTISACYDKKGLLRVIDIDANQVCSTTEKPLSWNKQGSVSVGGTFYSKYVDFSQYPAGQIPTSIDMFTIENALKVSLLPYDTYWDPTQPAYYNSSYRYENISSRNIMVGNKKVLPGASYDVGVGSAGTEVLEIAMPKSDGTVVYASTHAFMTMPEWNGSLPVVSSQRAYATARVEN